MTIRERMKKSLENKGMWPNDAETVMQIAEKDAVLESMEDRWNHDISEYPAALLFTTFYVVHEIAKKWVEENHPKAFYLQNFRDKEASSK